MDRFDYCRVCQKCANQGCYTHKSMIIKESSLIPLAYETMNIYENKKNIEVLNSYATTDLRKLIIKKRIEEIEQKTLYKTSFKVQPSSTYTLQQTEEKKDDMITSVVSLHDTKFKSETALVADVNLHVYEASVILDRYPESLLTKQYHKNCKDFNQKLQVMLEYIRECEEKMKIIDGIDFTSE